MEHLPVCRMLLPDLMKGNFKTLSCLRYAAGNTVRDSTFADHWIFIGFRYVVPIIIISTIELSFWKHTRPTKIMPRVAGCNVIFIAKKIYDGFSAPQRAGCVATLTCDVSHIAT